MSRKLLGIVLGAVAVYLWGFLFWGASNFAYSAWKTPTSTDEAIQTDLLKHFPETGTYYVPGKYHDPAELDALMQAGPTAFVHVNAREGRPMMMTSIMVSGFILCLVVAALITAILSLFPLAAYGDRVKLAALVGLTAVVAIHIGDAVWWLTPLDWKLTQSFYDLVQFGILGLVLARFTQPPQ